MMRLLLIVAFGLFLPEANIQAKSLLSNEFRLQQHDPFHANESDSIRHTLDTSCECSPSVAAEIAASSLTVGVLEYLSTRVMFERAFGDATENPALFPPALLLYLVTLAPVAEWTSGCEANIWNTVWIGFLAQAGCMALYGLGYGLHHQLDPNKIYVGEYLALGFAPAVITSLWYNHFLHTRPKDDRNSDQGMYLLPFVGADQSLSLNFGVRF
jgi:hypothetical protein